MITLTICGRIGSVDDVRTLDNGWVVLNFSVCVDVYAGKDKGIVPYWFFCESWRKTDRDLVKLRARLADPKRHVQVTGEFRDAIEFSQKQQKDCIKRTLKVHNVTLAGQGREERQDDAQPTTSTSTSTSTSSAGDGWVAATG